MLKPLLCPPHTALYTLIPPRDPRSAPAETGGDRWFTGPVAPPREPPTVHLPNHIGFCRHHFSDNELRLVVCVKAVVVVLSPDLAGQGGPTARASSSPDLRSATVHRPLARGQRAEALVDVVYKLIWAQGGCLGVEGR